MSRRKKSETEARIQAAFAEAHGKKWRDTLSMTYWYNARIWRDRSGKEHPVLHAIRNEFGPTWLYEHFKLPSEAA